MKKFIIYLLLSLITIISWASEPLKIGIISDTHFLSEQLMDDGYAVDNYIESSARDIRNVPYILDNVLSDYLKNDIQVLFVSGDITKDGEKQSHMDFVKKLKPLQDKGVKVFVIPGNHDIDTKAKRYVGNKAFDSESTTSEEFATIYADCGYNNALKKDTASLSYLALLNDKTWLLAIDVARGQYKKSGLSSEIISSQTEAWIVDILKEAREKQIQVIGMMHWGLVEHLPYQNQFFPRYLIYDNEYLARLLADNGMKVIFTGHFHSNDISSFSSYAGNTIYDVETGPLCSYPFVYRFATLTDKGIDISTKKITALPQAPLLAEQNKVLLRQLTKKTALEKLNAEFNFIQNKSANQKLAEIITDIFMLHVAGDEKIDKNLTEKMGQFSEMLGLAIYDDIFALDIETYPPDNKFFINF